MKNRGRCGKLLLKKGLGDGAGGISAAPWGLCSVCTQDTAALNPKKTLDLRSRFFQAARPLHLVWAAVGDDEECCSGLHGSQSIHEAPGVQGALCSGSFAQALGRGIPPAALVGAHPSLFC